MIVKLCHVSLFIVWLMRALQALSPGALVIFRNLTEAQEAACDDLAARATGKPAALASALLKAYSTQARRSPTGRESGLERARLEVARHAERYSLEQRVRGLLDAEPSGMPSRVVLLLTVLALGAMLWTIG